MNAKKAKKSKGLLRGKKLEAQKTLKGTFSPLPIPKPVDTSSP
jgi:hypothetical protein